MKSTSTVRKEEWRNRGLEELNNRMTEGNALKILEFYLRYLR